MAHDGTWWHVVAHMQPSPTALRGHHACGQQLRGLTHVSLLEQSVSRAVCTLQTKDNRVRHRSKSFQRIHVRAWCQRSGAGLCGAGVQPPVPAKQAARLKTCPAPRTAPLGCYRDPADTPSTPAGLGAAAAGVAAASGWGACGQDGQGAAGSPSHPPGRGQTSLCPPEPGRGSQRSWAGDTAGTLPGAAGMVAAGRAIRTCHQDVPSGIVSAAEV